MQSIRHQAALDDIWFVTQLYLELRFLLFFIEVHLNFL
jgi:hypothetical protein